MELNMLWRELPKSPGSHGSSPASTASRRGDPRGGNDVARLRAWKSASRCSNATAFLLPYCATDSMSVVLLLRHLRY